jgi:hypothetical protein
LELKHSRLIQVWARGSPFRVKKPQAVPVNGVIVSEELVLGNNDLIQYHSGASQVCQFQFFVLIPEFRRHISPIDI